MTDPVTLWWIAIVLAFVVTGVVAVLLSMIIATARDIQGGAAVIWARGQQVANNTIHIARLYRTKETVAKILGQAGLIPGDAQAIRDHARTCPGCVACIVGGTRAL